MPYITPKKSVSKPSKKSHVKSKSKPARLPKDEAPRNMKKGFPG